MNRSDPPLSGPPSSYPVTDELDRLLRSFFAHELPRRWPSLRTPEATLTGRRNGLLLRGRFALAASVAVLLGSGLLLAVRFPVEAPPGTGLGPDVRSVGARPRVDKGSLPPAAASGPRAPGVGPGR